MADDALFIGWGAVVRGREQQALEVFGETVAFWQEAQNAGRVESFEPCLLQPHGGGLAGFMLVRGARAQLDAVPRCLADLAGTPRRTGLGEQDRGSVAGAACGACHHMKASREYDAQG